MKHRLYGRSAAKAQNLDASFFEFDIRFIHFESLNSLRLRRSFVLYFQTLDIYPVSAVSGIVIVTTTNQIEIFNKTKSLFSNGIFEEVIW